MIQTFSKFTSRNSIALQPIDYSFNGIIKLPIRIQCHCFSRDAVES